MHIIREIFANYVDIFMIPGEKSVGLSLLEGSIQLQSPAVSIVEGTSLTASLTHAELYDLATARANLLASCFAVGDRILLSTSDRIEFVISFFACIRAGIVAVP